MKKMMIKSNIPITDAHKEKALNHMSIFDSDMALHSTLGVVYNKSTIETLCTFEDYVIKNVIGNTISIYICPESRIEVLKCVDCGAIFIRNIDTANLIPIYKCPFCTDYEIQKHEKEDLTIIKKDTTDVADSLMYSGYMALAKEEEESRRRYLKRKKHDWEIFKIVNKPNIKITLQCTNITKSYFKGLNITIQRITKEGRTYWKIIPLTIGGIIELNHKRDILNDKI